MASFLFITAYDEFALGIRTLAPWLEQHGHPSNLCFFKKFEPAKYAPYLVEEPNNYQTIHTVNDSGLFSFSGYEANPWTPKEVQLLVDIAEHENPDVIGISARNFIDEKLCGLLQRIKEKCPNALYLAGGFGPTFSPERYLKVCHFVVRGEGEGAVLDIADAVDADELDSIKRVLNVSYLNDGKVVHNKMRPLITTFDDYPEPRVARDGGCFFVEDNTVSIAEAAETYCLLIGRGCLNKCTYCCAGEWRKLYRKDGHKVKPYRPKKLQRALGEIRRAGENGFKYLFIADSFLVMDPESQKTLFREIEKYNLSFAAQLHPDIALKYPDVVEVAYECGLMVTVVGIQHGSETFSREVYHRCNSNEKILEFARLLSKFSQLQIQYHMITGNPLETDDDFEEQLAFIKQLRDDKDIRLSELSFNCLKLFPNTTLWKAITEQHIEQSIEDMIYKACMSLLRLELDDNEFAVIYEDRYYRKRPYFLINKLYELYLHSKMTEALEKERGISADKAAFLRSNKIVFDLGKMNPKDIQVSEHISDVTISEENYFVAEASGNDPWIILPALPSAGSGRYVCRTVLETEVRDSVFQIFYRDPEEPCANFSEENSVSLKISPGIQPYYISLDGVDPLLRVDFGNKPGKYVIHSLEIRETENAYGRQEV
ncbi:MAG: cobalamin-dependent protein [Deltaproteobacteria bacterium]|nr:cobalamin-dependent protein [Deltaproteobacteria bacterium]